MTIAENTNERSDREREADAGYVRELGKLLRRVTISVALVLTTYITLEGANPTTSIAPFTILLSLLALDATKSARSRIRSERENR